MLKKCRPAASASMPCITHPLQRAPACPSEFIERVELAYDVAAHTAGCYLASAMGFDSVPGDLLVEYTLSLFKPPARCTLVETALTIRGGASGFRGHFPTFESAVLGFASAGDLRKLRKEAEQVVLGCS